MEPASETVNDVIRDTYAMLWSERGACPEVPMLYVAIGAMAAALAVQSALVVWLVQTLHRVQQSLLRIEATSNEIEEE
jgi:hypothetical protein